MVNIKNIIGIGEYTICSNKVEKIKTYALASCVAVTAYSPLKKIAGMIHIALPKPGNEDDGKSRPGYYATTGIPLLINKLAEYGCKKEELEIRIYGGAESLTDNDIFNIGKRNINAVVETLSSLRLEINNAQIGGKVSRTIEMDVETGEVTILTRPIII